MTTGATAILPAAILDEDAWEVLSFEGGRESGKGANHLTRSLPVKSRLVKFILDDIGTLGLRNMAEGALFILPVRVDGTDAQEARVPERFKALHFTQLPGGRVTPEFAERLAELLKGKAR